jgi:hypothetical protein
MIKGSKTNSWQVTVTILTVPCVERVRSLADWLTATLMLVCAGLWNCSVSCRVVGQLHRNATLVAGTGRDGRLQAVRTGLI